MILNRKAIGPVVVMALLIVTTVVAVVAFQTWFGTYSSGIFTKSEGGTDDVGQTKVEDVVGSTVYFRNGKNTNLTVTEVRIGNTTCGISSDVVVTPGSGGSIDVGDCKGNLTNPKAEVVVYTTAAVYSSYFYFSEIGATITPTSPSSNLSATFAVSTSCSSGTRVFGLYNLTDGDHAEFYGSTNSANSVCVEDTSATYTIGVACSGTYERLFYLGNYTNSHVWFDNSSAYGGGSYNWTEVCVSSSGGTMDLQLNDTDISGDGYICLASYIQNDTYGGHISGCSTYSDRIWLSLS